MYPATTNKTISAILTFSLVPVCGTTSFVIDSLLFIVLLTCTLVLFTLLLIEVLVLL